MRDNRGYGRLFSPDFNRELATELSDVLWYVAAVAHELGWTLEEVASLGLAKLESRKQSGTLHGDGDQR